MRGKKLGAGALCEVLEGDTRAELDEAEPSGVISITARSV
jgi:hypothetical protein